MYFIKTDSHQGKREGNFQKEGEFTGRISSKWGQNMLNTNPDMEGGQAITDIWLLV